MRLSNPILSNYCPYCSSIDSGNQGSVGMTDERTKALSCGGKVHDKDKEIIVQSAQHNRNVLINERSIMNKGKHRGIKGHVSH